MSAQILKLTLLPGVDSVVFERTLTETILPKVQILRRDVMSISHRLFRADAGAPDSSTYVWLLFMQMVGSSPETAGEGPVILGSTPPVAEIASELATLAMVTSLSEI